MASPLLSLFGPLRPVLLPEHLACTDPQTIGEALLAYRFQLSREEVRLLLFLVEGLTYNQIAERLRLAEMKSVKHRIQSLYKKLGVVRASQAINIAKDYGLRSTFDREPPR